MRQGLRICLMGASGLVGSSVVEEAQGYRDLEIVSLARRRSSSLDDRAVHQLIGDPSDWPSLITGHLEASQIDVLVCTLGTTIRKAGSQEAFLAIDYDLVVRVAETARKAGVSRMIFVSSVGADPASSNFYLSVKGRLEAKLASLGFASLVGLRPGLLKCKRQEFRLAERVGQWVVPVVDHVLLHGPFRKFRSIDAKLVAKAIVALARTPSEGDRFLEYDDIVNVAS